MAGEGKKVGANPLARTAVATAVILGAVEEEIALAILNAMQGVANMCTQLCIQHLRALRLQMLREFTLASEQQRGQQQEQPPEHGRGRTQGPVFIDISDPSADTGDTARTGDRSPSHDSASGSLEAMFACMTAPTEDEPASGLPKATDREDEPPTQANWDVTAAEEGQNNATSREGEPATQESLGTVAAVEDKDWRGRAHSKPDVQRGVRPAEQTPQPVGCVLAAPSAAELVAGPADRSAVGCPEEERAPTNARRREQAGPGASEGGGPHTSRTPTELPLAVESHRSAATASHSPASPPSQAATCSLPAGVASVRADHPAKHPAARSPQASARASVKQLMKQKALKAMEPLRLVGPFCQWRLDAPGLAFEPLGPDTDGWTRHRLCFVPQGGRLDFQVASGPLGLRRCIFPASAPGIDAPCQLRSGRGFRDVTVASAEEGGRGLFRIDALASACVCLVVLIRSGSGADGQTIRAELLYRDISNDGEDSTGGSLTSLTTRCRKAALLKQGLPAPAEFESPLHRFVEGFLPLRLTGDFCEWALAVPGLTFEEVGASGTYHYRLCFAMLDTSIEFQVVSDVHGFMCRLFPTVAAEAAPGEAAWHMLKKGKAYTNAVLGDNNDGDGKNFCIRAPPSTVISLVVRLMPAPAESGAVVLTELRYGHADEPDDGSELFNGCHPGVALSSTKVLQLPGPSAAGSAPAGVVFPSAPLQDDSPLNLPVEKLEPLRLVGEPTSWRQNQEGLLFRPLKGKDKLAKTGWRGFQLCFCLLSTHVDFQIVSDVWGWRWRLFPGSAAAVVPVATTPEHGCQARVGGKDDGHHKNFRVRGDLRSSVTLLVWIQEWRSAQRVFLTCQREAAEVEVGIGSTRVEYPLGGSSGVQISAVEAKLTGSKMHKVWLRLSRCGRLPQPLPTSDVAIHVWLGEYHTAAAQCVDEKLRACIDRFITSLTPAQQKSRAFCPRKMSMQTKVQGKPGTCTEYGTYRAADGVLIGYVCLFPKKPRQRPPVLMLRWGGNEDAAAHDVKADLCAQELVAAGLAQIYFVDYRGYGWSEGTPSLATLRSDADAFYRELPAILRARGQAWPPAAQLVLMGHSLGALVALHLLALHADEIRAIVLLAASVCHWPMENVSGMSWDLLSEHLPPLHTADRNLSHCYCCRAGRHVQRRREKMWLDPVDLACCIDVPLLVVHGTRDWVCPPEQVEAVFDAAATTDKELFWIEGDHHIAHKSATYLPVFKRFLAGLERGRP